MIKDGTSGGRQNRVLSMRRVPEGRIIGAMLRINDHLEIHESELDYEFARSSGPGGQNVNKVETKVTLKFDIEASRSLTDIQKTRITEGLATRITKDGVLRVTSQRHRTREANRHAAIGRFIELVDDALVIRKPRKKTKVSRAAKKRRLENKKRTSKKKAMRRVPNDRE
jgi:ribosome-associated protein